jgi:multiple sugar transport system substrate-binding protein
MTPIDLVRVKALRDRTGGSSVITGTTEAFNSLTGHWEKYPLNVVSNTKGWTRHCVISRLSKKKEATYYFPAFMANRKNAFFNSTKEWTGVQPAMKYEYFPPVGTGNVVEMGESGLGQRGRSCVAPGLP